MDEGAGIEGGRVCGGVSGLEVIDQQARQVIAVLR